MTTRVSFGSNFQPIPELAKQTLSFIRKLMDDPANPSLHIEPIHHTADSRVRTGRINNQYRAVLFQLDGTKERQFLLESIKNHDEAIAYAKKVRLRSNPVNGVIEVISDAPLTDPQDIKEEIESRAKQLAAEKIAEERARAEAAAVAQPVAVPQPSPQETLRRANVTEEELTDVLGVSPLAIEALNQAETEADLDRLLEGRPDWEKDALFGILAGMTPQEVIEELELGDAQPAEPATEEVPEQTAEESADELITKVRESGHWVEASEPALRHILEHGTFPQWCAFLHPSQRQAVEAEHRGSARILGGAGTGKTVVLLHRAKYLLEHKDNKARILLTTFNRELANQLKAQMTILDPNYKEATTSGAPGLWISGIDSLIHLFIHRARKDEIRDALKETLGISTVFTPQPMMDNQLDQVWEEAAELNGEGLDPEKKQPRFLEDEFRDVILANSITSQKSYLRVPRTGRRTALGRNERKIVWAIVDSYIRKCALKQSLSFAAIATLAAHILEHRRHPHFDHVLVDEAQDFHAGHWRFIRACVGEGPNDIMLAEDSHQRIYGRRLVLSKFGIHTRGRATRKLRLNYRTTAQNLSYASAILDGAEWIDSAEETDGLEGYRSVRTGPNPTLVSAPTKADELQTIMEFVRAWQQANSPSTHIGVLARSRRSAKAISDHLAEQGITVSTARSGVSSVEAEVSVMTMHNAKGMEFSHVILANVSDKAIPRMIGLDSYAEAEREDALQRERALLYVAASRARDELVITVTGEPSALLPRIN